ncbi:lycopene cyclase domain-containing protein [Labilibacter marinus]|uniref:lycopene cyclase domain-containing protein n=1 Tax=Labilibacter marinus TaxID=1477105 RepID=UPI00095026A6|nr:lycopene cyclase domain-containing protein [Labilibacter marinus]
MSLYFLILLLSGAVPFLYSFNKRLRFYKYWPSLIISTILIMIPYLIWDKYFTENAYWGFNELYLSGIYFFSLPLEEILFFVVIPYCCVFTFYSLKYYFPKLTLSKGITIGIGVLLLLLSAFMVITKSHLAYTFINFSFLFMVVLLALIFNIKLLSDFLWVFPVILVPFFIVNGVLTGFGIEQEVVWYNPDVFMGIRLFTIPLEDTFYAFSMLLSNLLLMDVIEKRIHKIKTHPAT